MSRLTGITWERDLGVKELTEHLEDRQESCWDEANKIYCVDRLHRKEQRWIVDEINKCQNDFIYAARNYFWIVDKRGVDLPFRLWESQELVLDHYLRLREQGKPQKIMILKARRLGISTLVEGLMAWRTMFFPNQTGMVVSYKDTHSEYLFGIMLHIYEMMPWWLKPMVQSIKYGRSLIFDNPNRELKSKYPGLGSQIVVQSATQLTSAGQGYRLSCVHLCLSPEAPIITGGGVVKRIADVSSGDLVLTSSGEMKPVRKVWESCRRNEITSDLWLWGNFSPLSTTVDHPVLTPDGFRPAGDLRCGDFVRFPVRSITKKTKTFSVDLYPTGGRHKNKKAMARAKELPCSYDFGYLFGLYLAEGTIVLNKRLSEELQGSHVIFSIHRKEESGVLDRIKRAVGEEYTPKIYRHTSLTSVVRLYGSGLARFIRREFGRTDGKRIPDWVWDCGEEFCKGILIGYLDGDGSFAGKGTLPATSIRLAIPIQLRNLSASLGYGWPGLYFKEGGLLYGRNCQKAWTLAFNGKSAAMVAADAGRYFDCAGKDALHWRYSSDKKFIDIEVATAAQGFSERFYDLEVDAPEHDFCTIHCNVKNSEWLDWPDDKAKEIIEEDVDKAIEDEPENFGFLESTAKGAGRYGHLLWRQCVELKEEAKWRPVFLPWFFEKNRVRELPLDWELQDPERMMRERIEREWVRCDDQQCAAYRESVISGEDNRGAPCPMCGVGVMRPVILTDKQLAWMARERINAAFDIDSKKKLLQELCVAGDTRISSDLGILPVVQLENASVVDGNPMRGWLSNGVKPVFRLTTKFGRVLKCTSDHCISTPNGDVELGGLKAGDAITLSNVHFAGSYHREKWEFSPGCCFDLLIDESWGRFLGYFMGDGCWGKDRISIAIDGKDQDVIADVSECVEKVIGHAPRIIRFKNYAVLESSDIRWRVLLRQLGAIEKWTSCEGWHRKVSVPDCIWRSPRSVVKEFLSGLFEADAHAYRDSPRTKLFSKHEYFLRDVQLLLLGFGITSQIGKNDKINSQGRRFVGRDLTLRCAASNLFHAYVGFRSNRKKSTACTRSSLRKYGWKNQMIDWVALVEPCGEEPVFDVSVPATEHFSANGILVHNCSTSEESFQLSGYPVFSEKELAFANSTIASEPEMLNPPGMKGFLDDKGNFHADIAQAGVSGSQPSTKCFTNWCKSHHKWDEKPLKIYELPMPGARYTIGADVSEGIGGRSDYSVGVVLRVGRAPNPDVQVATYRSNEISPIDFAAILNFLGRWYNEAMMSVEVNKYDACFQFIRYNYMYPNLFRWKHLDSTNPLSSKWGWWTNMTTKPRLWQTTRKFLKDKLLIVRDPQIYEEMKTFQKEDSEDRGASAELNAYDDSLMACMIALYTSHDLDWDESGGYMPMCMPGSVTGAKRWTVTCTRCGTEWQSDNPSTEECHEQKCLAMGSGICCKRVTARQNTQQNIEQPFHWENELAYDSSASYERDIPYDAL